MAASRKWAIDAIIAERKARTPAELAEQPATLFEHGTNQHREEVKAETDKEEVKEEVRTETPQAEPVKRGETANYLTARIARDHPEVLERMKAGEFKSVRAAAIVAGIVKVPISLQ